MGEHEDGCCSNGVPYEQYYINIQWKNELKQLSQSSNFCSQKKGEIGLKYFTHCRNKEIQWNYLDAVQCQKYINAQNNCSVMTQPLLHTFRKQNSLWTGKLMQIYRSTNNLYCYSRKITCMFCFIAITLLQILKDFLVISPCNSTNTPVVQSLTNGENHNRIQI
jgi:hypothetical protein